MAMIPMQHFIEIKCFKLFRNVWNFWYEINIIFLFWCINYHEIKFTDYQSTPWAVSLRIVFLCFAMFSYVIFSFYSARLTSFLTMTTNIKPFNSIKELIEDHDWRIYTLQKTSQLSELEVSFELCFY